LAFPTFIGDSGPPHRESPARQVLRNIQRAAAGIPSLPAPQCRFLRRLFTVCFAPVTFDTCTVPYSFIGSFSNVAKGGQDSRVRNSRSVRKFGMGFFDYEDQLFRKKVRMARTRGWSALGRDGVLLFSFGLCLSCRSAKPHEVDCGRASRRNAFHRASR